MKRVGVFCLVVVLIAVTSATAQAAEDTPYTLGGPSWARALVAGQDGAVWFVAAQFESPNLILGKVTSAGVVTEFPLSARASRARYFGSEPEAIIAGPDGDLWFGERGGIGRGTTTGEVTSFPLPAGASAPTAMAIGPDGNIWLTEGAASKIGRITPSGQFAQFPLPPGRKPSGIAAGPDGNLWFTEWAANKIGRITPTGAITEFRVPGPWAKLDSIAAGPDGNLWFGEDGAPRIGKITPSGAVTHFTVPTKSGTSAIVSGPGGLLWFASNHQIGAISPTGAISWPSCLVPYCDRKAEALAIGPEGRLWASSGAEECVGLCGGGTAIALSRSPGLIEPYVLPPLRLAIGPRLAPIRNDRTSLTVACGLKSGCKGRLRLGRYVVRHRKSVVQNLSQADYELNQEESKRITLRFSSKVAAFLRNQRPSLLAIARNEGGPSTSRYGLQVPR
jgi:virginiamycin B lyase